MAPKHSAAPVPTEMRWLEDFPRVHRARVECATPASEAELAALLRWASQERRTVTVRGGGRCLHGQSVGDDLVIDVSALRRISVDVEAGVVTAGAGARWSDVFAALPPGWVLPNLVTTGAASVGGTLVADAASRFSSAFGPELDGVRRARLMTADGTILEGERGGANDALLSALGGSVGLLGVVLSVEHRLLDLRHLAAPGGALRVKTVARKHPDARGLLADLALELRVPPSRRSPRGAYGLLIPGGGALLFHSMYTRAPRGRRMPNHRRHDPLRGVIERMLHVPAISRALWPAIFTHYYGDGDVFVDEAEDFSFFMDSGPTVRAPGARLWFASTLLQQVLELPFDASAEACRAASALVDACGQLCRARGILPVGWDVLAVRGAPSHTLRLSTAVPIRSASDAASARAFLAAQATLAASHGARVLFGKGVYADAATLAATSGEALGRLQHLKERLDPNGLFGGPFFREVLAPAMALSPRPERERAATAWPRRARGEA